MKFLVLLLLSVNAFALDVGNLNYFVPKGNFNYQAEVERTSTTAQVEFETSGFDAKVKILQEQDTLNNNLIYGLSDRLNIGLTHSYSLREYSGSRSYLDGAFYSKQGSSDYDGMIGYGFGVSYLIMDQRKDQPLYWKVGVLLAPKMGNAKNNEKGDDNAYTGNSQQTYLTSLGQIRGDYEWYGTVQHQALGKVNNEKKSDSSITTIAGSFLKTQNQFRYGAEVSYVQRIYNQTIDDETKKKTVPGKGIGVLANIIINENSALKFSFKRIYYDSIKSGDYDLDKLMTDTTTLIYSLQF